LVPRGLAVILSGFNYTEKDYFKVMKISPTLPTRLQTWPSRRTHTALVWNS